MRFLKQGIGYQIANRRRALSFVTERLPGLSVVDERTVKFPPYGTCHFAAFTDPNGAMISTPNGEDNEFGSADWHHRDAIMMFRDFGDGRCIVYVTPIKPLFALRTIGHHSVTWANVLETAAFTQVFKVT